MIEQKVNYSFSNYTTLAGLDYSRLSRAYDNSDSFMGRDQLNFTSNTGCAYLTGNELLQYPELAKALCDFEEYPIYKKSHPVSEELKDLKGLNFLIAFTDYVKICQADFAEEVSRINAKINNLIYLHGAKKTTPAVTGVLKYEHNNYIHSLIISGVTFKLIDRHTSDTKSLLTGIRLSRLIDCAAYDAEYANLDAVLLNTPYIALRVKKSWKHTGRVIWYNLDKMEVVTTAEINAIKKKGHYQEVKNKE